MSAKREVSIATRITNLQLQNFEVAKSAQKLNPTKFVYDYALGINVDVQANCISLECTCKVLKDKSKTVVLATMLVSADFAVDNLQQIALNCENKLPIDILYTYTDILLGALRGFICLKSKNTLIQGALMPMMGPQVFFGEQSYLNLETHRGSSKR